MLGAHYRSPLTFSIDAVQGAHTALENIAREVKRLTEETAAGTPISDFTDKFESLINEDMEMPQAVALFQSLIGDKKVKPDDKLATILGFDTVFGLDLVNLAKKMGEIPKGIVEKNTERETARQEKNFQKADELRKEIEQAGFNVYDSAKGSVIERKLSSLI